MVIVGVMAAPHSPRTPSMTFQVASPAPCDTAPQPHPFSSTPLVPLNPIFSGPMASYTVEQERLVKRVLKHPPNRYYGVLEVSKEVLDGELKKLYRKLAIRLHPDKNPHPQAPEAFKVVNKAWEVLLDPSKKRISDQTGADPDLRASQYASGASPFASGRSPFTGGGGVTEEDLFNMFFGGAPGQTFSFGSGGFQFHQFGGGSPFGAQRQREQARGARAAGGHRRGEPLVWDTLKQILPVFLFLLFPLVTLLFGLGSDLTPQYSLLRLLQYSHQRQMPETSEFYYVSDLVAKRLAEQLLNFDRKVEQTYLAELFNKCVRERTARQELMEEAQGWFRQDTHKMKRAQAMRMPHCERLQSYGLL